MRGKFLFFLGLAVGYVFGTRAGRRRYEQIKTAAQNIWDSEPVQWSVHQAQGAVGEVTDDVLAAAKRVIHQVTGDKPATATRKPASRRPAATKAAPAKAAAKTAAKPVAKPTAEPAARKTAAKPTPEA
jgi:hypothetical protein